MNLPENVRTRAVAGPAPQQAPGPGGDPSALPVLPAVELLTQLQTIIDSTPGPAAAPSGSLCRNLVVQRVIAAAILHWNASHDPRQPGTRLEKLPGSCGETPRYFARCAAADCAIIFSGSVDFDGNIENVREIKLSKDGKERPLDGLRALFEVLGVPQTNEALGLLIKSAAGYREFLGDMACLDERVDAWLRERGIERRPQSLREFILAALLSGGQDGVFDLNAVLEGLHRERDPRFIGFINELPSRYRPSAISPFPLLSVACQAQSVVHRAISDEHAFMLEGGRSWFLVHPHACAVMGDLPFSKEDRGDPVEVLFHPAISSRSGTVKIKQRPQGYMVKLDLPARIGSGIRTLGPAAVEEEVAAAEFIAENMAAKPPPTGLSILLTSEGVIYPLPDGRALATLLRPIPEKLRDTVFIPGAILYSSPTFGGRTFVEELVQDLSSREAENLFVDRLIKPLMSAWEYFLSMTDRAGAEGMTPELHSANVYYAYDPGVASVLPHLIVKDFERSRILYSDGTAAGQERMTRRVIEAYDQLMGRLFIEPLVDAVARSGKISVPRCDELVRSAFADVLSRESKERFLLAGEVVGCIHDNFSLLQGGRYEIVWTSSPRFRPQRRSDYLK